MFIPESLHAKLIEEKLKSEKIYGQGESKRKEFEVGAIGFDTLGNCWIFDGNTFKFKNYGDLKIKYKSLPVEIDDYNWYDQGDTILVFGIIGVEMPYEGTVITFKSPHKAKLNTEERVLEVE